MPLDRKRVYEKLMQIGTSSGCHQQPERSFFYHGYQFPVCARCTGVVLGQFAGMVLFFIYPFPRKWFGFLLFVMFFDWFVQRMEILESTNLRRLLTGMCCGYALGQFYVWVLLKGFYYVYGLVGGRI